MPGTCGSIGEICAGHMREHRVYRDNIYSNDLMGNNNQINGILYADISDHLPILVLTKLNSDFKDDIIIETRK